MGSKKHKKHKSERREKPPEAFLERQSEPLRLVLKVGGSSASEHGDSPHVQPHPEVYMEERTFRLPEKHKKSKKKKKKKSNDREREKKHKHHHHHHEKKEKRKRERLEEMPEDPMDITLEQVENEEPPAKQALYQEEVVAERSFREPRACTLKNRQGKSALQHLLDHLLKTLERKDPQQFFAWPVTDHIAPGYSSIIAHPMDFSTMRTKIDNNEYSNIAEFNVDVKLMCDNAMTYNHPETIYYKSAKRLFHIGMKMTTKDKLLELRTTLTYISELGREELGFELHDELQTPEMEGVNVSIVTSTALDEIPPSKDAIKTKLVVKPSKQEIGDDGMTPDEILAHAKRAARAAADKLTLRRPNSKFGFLRQQNDGSTSLAILNPTNGWEEQRVTLEMLVGKLQHGTGSLPGYKEDKRNIAKPVNYLNYGNYGSYAPTYDSTFANLTKEESDLIYSTYGDETGVQYAESLLNFTRDCSFVSEMADSLLNLLTNSEHSKTTKIIEAKKRKAEEAKKEEKKSKTKKEEAKYVPSPALDFDFEALKSLADEGIDVSFLDSLEKQMKKDPIQRKLDETTSLLQDLAKVQNARLSAKPPLHLAHIPGPSSEELQLAAKVTESLTELSKKATPGDVLSVEAIRKSMGIAAEPSCSSFGDVAAAMDDEEGEGGTLCGEAVVGDDDDLTTSLRLPDGRPPSLVDQASASLDCPSAAMVTDRHVEPVEGSADGDLVAVGDMGHPMDSSPQAAVGVTDDQAVDLEVELREFLETGPSLRVPDSPTHVDVSLDDVIP